MLFVVSFGVTEISGGNFEVNLSALHARALGEVELRLFHGGVLRVLAPEGAALPQGEGDGGEQEDGDDDRHGVVPRLHLDAEHVQVLGQELRGHWHLLARLGILNDGADGVVADGLVFLCFLPSR